MRPVEPITYEKAKEAISYLKATYDSNGRLVRLTKYWSGKMYFVQIISYDEAGDITKIIVKDAEGKVTDER